MSLINENIVNSFVNDDVFNKIVSFLTVQKSLNLSFFKQTYLKRRIYFRAIALKFSDINEYFKFLIFSEEEVNKFRDILTVNVTSFFRNPEVFDVLKNKVLPEIFAQKSFNKERFIKILSVGCASGEEPYSIAIILKEYFSEEIKVVKPYILGIDFDKESINHAVVGVFEQQKILNVPNVIKKKYFSIIGYKHYSIDMEIKKMVIFRQEDIFAKDLKKFWDIVLCRNVLIYINPESQEILLDKIISACREGSYLVLGKSEGLVGKLRNSFVPKFPKERIYVKRRKYES